MAKHAALHAALCLLIALGCGDNVAGDDAGGGGPDAGGGIDAGPPGNQYVSEWQQGDPGLTSIDQVAFAPDGTLFLLDGAAGRIAAIDLGEASESERDANHFEDLMRFGRSLADALGGGTDGLSIGDVDVHPITHEVFVTGRSSTASGLVRTDGAGTVLAVDLSDVRHAVVTFSPDAAGSYGADLDLSSTHLFASVGSRSFTSGRVISVPFPLGAGSASSAATTRTYHRSHRQWEESDTVAPVDRLMVVDDADPPFLAASYACAPVVRLPASDVVSGGQVLGQTPFDVGAGRQLLDLFGYSSGGADRVLITYNASDGMRILLRADRALLEQTEAIDEAAPVVVDGTHMPSDTRVTRYPEYDGVLAVAPRGDHRFVIVFGDGRVSTRDLP